MIPRYQQVRRELDYATRELLRAEADRKHWRSAWWAGFMMGMRVNCPETTKSRLVDPAISELERIAIQAWLSRQPEGKEAYEAALATLCEAEWREEYYSADWEFPSVSEEEQAAARTRLFAAADAKVARAKDALRALSGKPNA